MELVPCPVYATTFMITKDQFIGFFGKSKVIFATTAAVITFTITLYNQFKSSRWTEISGSVSSVRTAGGPVDATVDISSPVPMHTETDNRGRFKFKIENLQTDTFLIIVQNKRTHTVMKQNEYVSASHGRTDITVVFDSSMVDGQTYSASDTTRLRRRGGGPNLNNVIKKVTGLFH
jgi:hypothetical protein